MERKPDARIAYIPDIHGHAKGEHKAFAEERPIPYTARMLFLWFFHACRRSSPRFLMVADHMNYLTFEDPAAVNLVRRALKLAQAGDLYGAAETAGVELGHAAVVSEGLKRGMRYSIGAEIDNDPRCRPDAQNIVDAMKPDGMIRSIHFLAIAHPQHGENWMWAFDNPEFKGLYDVVGPANVWEIYMATLLDAIEKLPGNIVGHFYVPAKFGHWPEDDVLEAYEDRFVAACAERGMAIEINSRYFYKYYVLDDAALARYRSAHMRLLRKAKAANVMIAVGSDAHSPKDQGNAFETVLELLDEADINEIAFPIGGRLARVALRATEDVLRQHNAALAPPRVERPAPKIDGDEHVAHPETTSKAPPAAAVASETSVARMDDAETNATIAEVPKSATRPSRSRAKSKVPEAVAVEPGVAESETAPVAETTPAFETMPKKRSHKKGGGAVKVTLADVLPQRDATPPVDERSTDSMPAETAGADAGTVHTVPTEATPVGTAGPEALPVDATYEKPEPRESDRKSAAPEPAPLAKAARSTKSATAAPARLAVDARKPPAKPPAKPGAKPVAEKAVTVKSAPARKTSITPPKAATKATSAAKPTLSKSAPAKKSAKKTVAKAPARPTSAKKSPAKPAARAAKKAPAKRVASVKKTIAKAPKRSVPAKGAPGKKNASKKPVAKKKSSRARR